MTDETPKEMTGEAATAAARSRTYELFARLFDYPDRAFGEAIRNGQLAEAVRETLRALDPSLLEGADWSALGNAGEAEEDLAVEYTRLFDVGASGPPCPLYGGLYAGARMKTMEETVRFYNHFGLTLSDQPREMPDHITTELEFLHFLAFREAEALQGGEDPGPFRRAQRDFATRHPGRWVPQLRERVEDQDPMPFFRELVCQLERFLANDQARLAELTGPSPDSLRSS
jgi:DMSO reductase family type II enzyme chaperone